jgi:hypothetical protein
MLCRHYDITTLLIQIFQNLLKQNIMNIYKSLFILFISTLLFTSCSKDAAPEEQYIGQWNISDFSGEGTVSDKSTGLTFDTKIIFDSGDHSLMINEDRTVTDTGSLNATMELYLGATLVTTVPFDNEFGGMEEEWSLDENDQFVSEGIEDFVFEGNVLTFGQDIDLNLADMSDGLDVNMQVDLDLSFTYIRQ